MRKKLLLILGFLLGASALAVAQLRTVKGTVTSAEDGSPLVQLTVIIKGTTTGVVTDMDGKYSITAPSADAVLIFKYTGFKNQEIMVGNQSTIDVVMQPAMEEIDQVVVVGYGSAKKAGTIVGQVTSVSSKDLEAKPVANVMEAVGPKVAGMSVLSSSGEPGQLASVQIHGDGSLGASGSPLYVIDGMPVSAGTVLAMNPSDFESVSVLKDASATSIYGARAANGVIFITTKRGRKEENGRVVVRGMYGHSSLANTDYYKIGMNTPEYFAFWEKLGILDADTKNNIDAEYGWNEGKTTEWYKEIYSAYAPTYSGDITFSGATQRTNYYISAGYFYQKGLRAESYFSRYTVRGNMSARVYEWLSVGLNTTLMYNSSRRNIFGGASLTGLPQTIKPYIPTTDKEGNPIYGAYWHNGLVSRDYIEDHRKGTRGSVGITSLGFIQLTPLRGLTVKSQAGVETDIYMGQGRNLPSAFWNKPKNGVGPSRGRSSVSSSRTASFTVTNTAEYKFSFLEDHFLSFLAGQEFIFNDKRSFDASASGATNDKLMQVQENPYNKDITQGLSQSSFLSFFVRAEYNYLGRYFLDASFRNDNSSKFGADNRNGQFWSVGAMWKAKNESFLEDVSWLDKLDVKGSAGTSGNAGIPNYLAYSRVGTTQMYKGGNAYTYANVPNPTLTWEKQTQVTVGTDFSLFRMVNVDLSWYYRLTSSMLMDTPLPTTTGFGSRTENVGSLSNMGVDLKIDVTAWSNNEGDYVQPYLTFNYNRQRVEELFGGRKYWIIPGTSLCYVVGKPVTFYMPLFYDINPENGLPRWYKPGPDPTSPQRNASEILEAKSMPSGFEQSTGKPHTAPINGGFGLNASYWGFYLNADFMYCLGKWLINNDRYFLENPVKFELKNMNRKLIDNYWEKPGDVKDYPGVDAKEWMSFDDRLLEDASFIRMKNLTLGYIVPKRWINKTKFFRSAKVYGTLRNFMTLTKFSGADPEPNSNLVMGQNPNTRQWSVGIELQF